MNLHEVVAVMASHIEAWYWRITYWFLYPVQRRHNGHERRRNPRSCVLCSGPMRLDTRPPRDVRGPDGKIRRLPAEVLSWHRCSRCHGSQVGIVQ